MEVVQLVIGHIMEVVQLVVGHTMEVVQLVKVTPWKWFSWW